MDYSSSSSPPNNNNLSFSLSNTTTNNHFIPSHAPSSSNNLSLFNNFTSSPSSTPSSLTGISKNSSGSVNAAAASSTVGIRGTNLSIFTVTGNKLEEEDFLGASTALITSAPACTTTHELHQFSTSTHTHSDNNNIYLYDSELKKTIIAACFPPGFAAEPTTTAPTTQKPSPKKTVDTFGQRTSIYRGVTRHRWTGRYEAHLWDNSCRREGQSRKGRQVYLGGYDKEDKAARAYDLAALKYWGPTTTTNFPIDNYEKDLQEMKNMTRQEFVASLRRKSSGFSRGASIYRGVTRHHQHGRWQARIGRVAGNKDLYLGTFSTQEEAAEAYDIAAIKFRGLNAVTNFDMSRYDVKSIANTTLPIGGLSNNNKNSSSDHCVVSVDSSKSQSDHQHRDLSSSVTTFASSSHLHQPSNNNNNNTLSFAIPIKQDPSDYWSILGFHQNNVSIPSSNNNNNNTTTLQSSAAGSTIPFTMDFSAPSNSIYVQQQNGSTTAAAAGGSSSSSSSSSTSSSIPLATPIFSLNSNTSSSYENNGGNTTTTTSYGNWIGQNMHTFQTLHATKPSLFQTPIFGME